MDPPTSPAFGAFDDDDRESGGSQDGSSENDQDGQMDDREDEDMDTIGDPDADIEGGGDNEDENDDEDDDHDQDDSQDSGHKLARASQASLQSTSSDLKQGSNFRAPTSQPNPSMLLTSPSPTQESIASSGFAIEPPKICPEALTASVYDIVPTIAAPHSTSINAITATPDLRWVFTGGADGYIRKFNWLETANGKSMLTVAQRHPFVDSVTKAGVLMSYWENNEESNGKPSEDNASISSAYSLAVQRDGLWLLSGLESGGVNLQSVRVDEGKRITQLRGHTSAVSVLNLAHDERSVLSGSWDKTIINWDLNTGQMIRKFEGSGGQISAIETRPLSSLAVPEASGEILEPKSTLSTNNGNKVRTNSGTTNINDDEPKLEPLFGDQAINGDAGSPNDSLFGGNDGDSLFGDNENDVGAPSGGHFVDEDDDFSRAIADGMREQVEQPDTEPEKPKSDPEGDVQMKEAVEPPTTLPTKPTSGANDVHNAEPAEGHSSSEGVPSSSAMFLDGVSHDDEVIPKINIDSLPDPCSTAPTSDSTFLAADINGSLRVWDKRQSGPIAKIIPRNVPPWCMSATWSPDGNFIYAGRRNGTVDEYSLHKGLRGVERSFKLPNNSGPVSALRAMPNGRHLICASYDILRLYDLQQQQIFKHATVPFLIVPGHRTGVVASLYMDPTCRYLISAAGNRGWEGSTTEVLLGYEIGVPK